MVVPSVSVCKSLGLPSFRGLEGGTVFSQESWFEMDFFFLVIIYFIFLISELGVKVVQVIMLAEGREDGC